MCWSTSSRAKNRLEPPARAKLKLARSVMRRKIRVSAEHHVAVARQSAIAKPAAQRGVTRCKRVLHKFRVNAVRLHIPMLAKFAPDFEAVLENLLTHGRIEIVIAN